MKRATLILAGLGLCIWLLLLFEHFDAENAAGVRQLPLLAIPHLVPPIAGLVALALLKRGREGFALAAAILSLAAALMIWLVP